MRLGIDASNLRSGGTRAHLVELLTAAQPAEFGFEHVIVWAGRETLDQLPNRPWLEGRHEPLLDGSLPFRLYWQAARLSSLARQNCDLLFVPGGNYVGAFSPVVTMSQNLVPFEPLETQRYGLSFQRLRLQLLQWGHTRAFRKSSGVIFLSEYARTQIAKQVAIGRRPEIIPHGIEDRFRCTPRLPRSLADCSPAQPLRLLYVSTVDLYKHQDKVAEAVAELRRRNLPVVLDLVGSAYGPALRRLRATLGRVDPEGNMVRYLGPVVSSEMPAIYRAADVFVFASSCESLPNILLEAMASGLPIACSDRGSMPEILSDAGVYFDPEDPHAIAAAVESLLRDAELRERLSTAAYQRAQQYTWERCAEQTFAFLASVAGANGAANRFGSTGA